MTLEELKIVLGLDSSGVKKGAKDAEDTISKTVSTIVTKLGALSAAFAAAFSIGAQFQPYLQQADAMGKLANAIDVDIEKMDAWGQAAARSGGSAEAFQGSLQSLTAQLARQATMGTSRAAKLLEGAGIDAGELGRQRDAFAVMMDLAEKAETMGKAEFFGLARALGLDQGTIMLLQQGRQGLKDLVYEMKKYGVYTKEDADLTANFNDNMANSQKAFHSLSTIIFRMILPALNKFHAMFNDAMALLIQHETFVKVFIGGIALAITSMLLPALKLLAARLAALALNPVVLKLTAIIALITLLALAIEDMFGWMDGKDAEWADFWAELWGTSDPDKAKEKFENFKKSVVQFFTDIQAGFGEFGKIVAKVVLRIMHLGESWDIISEAFKKRIEQITNKWEELTASFSSGIDRIKSWFSSLGEVIQNAFGNALDWAKEKWDNTIGKLEFPSFSGGNSGGDTKGGKFADGGIFTKPTRALIGESGAEAVIPFSPGKRNRGLELIGKIAGNFMDSAKNVMPNINIPPIENVLPDINMPPIENAMPTINISPAQALPMGGASTVNNTTDTRVTVGTVNINAEDGTDAANQFMSGVESRAQMWTAAANAAY